MLKINQHCAKITKMKCTKNANSTINKQPRSRTRKVEIEERKQFKTVRRRIPSKNLRNKLRKKGGRL